ncbi:MAG TPA: dihydrodipicolinate synthase family protein, partial [Wenzhouxiangella sp.]
ISVASNIVPNTMARLCALAKDQQFDKARRINRMLEPLYEFLGVETNPVPAKWLLAQMGRCQDAIRLPLVGLDSQYHAKGQALIESIKAIDENMGGE